MAEYGRREIIRVLRKNYLLGLLISVSIHGVTAFSWYAAEHFREEEDVIPSVKVRILRYSDLGPPPSLTARPALPTIAVATIAKPSFGTPVPVPDLQVSPEQTVANQEELANLPSPVGEDLAENGKGLLVEQDITPGVGEDADEPGIDDVVPVDKSPEMVSIVLPKYPEMAIRAGIEGTVVMKLLVGKDGKVLKAVIVKSGAEIFNEVTAEAAMKFVFTPAYTQRGPLKVWFEIPFTFRLKSSTLANKG